MSSVKRILKICGYLFRTHQSAARVWLGYLLGIVMAMQQAFGYLAYAADAGEAINVLEAFIVVGNNYNRSMFLALGWLLVVSDAPFINDSTRYVLCRSNRKEWNRAAYLYIFLQAVVYYALMAGATVVFSAGNGYFANIWSAPLAALTDDVQAAAAYNVSFSYPSLIRTVSVFTAFFCTWLLNFLYGLILGLLLYAADLFMRPILGAGVAFLFHFLGYEVMKEGYMLSMRYSLLARSIAALQIGGAVETTVPETLVVFAVIAILLCAVPNRIVRYR